MRISTAAFAVVFVAATVAVCVVADGNETGYSGWRNAGGNPQGTSFAAEVSSKNGRRWTYAIQTQRATVNAGPVISADGNTVYVADLSGTVSALEIPHTNLFTALFTGMPKPKLLWQFAAPQQAPIKGTPALSKDGKILVVGYSDPYQAAVAIDTSTGKAKWTVVLGSAVDSSPVIASDAKTVFVGASLGAIYALDIETGEGHWACKGKGLKISGMSLSDDEKQVYWTSMDFYVRSAPVGLSNCGWSKPGDNLLQCSFGCQTWGQSLSVPIISTPAFDGSNKTLFAATTPSQPGATGILYAFYNTLEWNAVRRQLYIAPTAITSGVAVSKGKALFAVGRELYCVDTDSGALVWKQAFGVDEKDGITATPVTNGEVVAFGTREGRFYVVELSTGKQHIEYKFNDATGGFVASPAVDSEGYLVTASLNGIVWSLGGSVLGSPSLTVDRIIFGVVAGGLFLCTCIAWCRMRDSKKPALDTRSADYQEIVQN